MAENPYAPPSSPVQDVYEALPDGDFIPGGQGVAAGRGWRWIADAWTFTSRDRGTFIGVFLLLFVSQIVLGLIPVVGSIATTLLYPVLIGGFMVGCDAVRGGQPLRVGHLLAGFQSRTRSLLTLGAIWLLMGVVLMLAMFLIAGAGIVRIMFTGAEPDAADLLGAGMMLVWALLAVLALSVPMAMATLFAPALVVFRDMRPVAAMKASFSACLRNMGPFLVWSVMSLLLSVAASIPLLLGWLLLGPVLMVSLYLSYRDIFYVR